MTLLKSPGSFWIRLPEITGPSRRGRLVGVMCRTFQCLRADFFAFRFVSDFRRRQPIATIQEIFTDGSSETKWPLGSKRNALPKRAQKPPEGSRRNLRDTGGEKKCQESRHGQRQKNLRATWRAPVPPAVRRSGGCRPMSPCPETPVPVLRIRSGRSRRRSGCPVLPVPSCSPGATPLLPGQDRVRWPGPGKLRDPGFHPDRCRNAGG